VRYVSTRVEAFNVTYEYRCTACEHRWEQEQKISEPAENCCPQCHKETAERLVSGGAGFQLVGNGWFKTGGY